MSVRWRWAALGVALVIATVATGFVYLRGGSTPVSVDSAVERFRGRGDAVTAVERATPQPPVGAKTHAARDASAPAVVESASTERGRPMPAEGVYVYATTGGDEVNVLGGSRHEYPPETTVTIRHGGCGVIERWDALEERWDERESCRTSQGDRLKRMTSFHEFYGRADERTMHCTGFTYPAGFEPGQTWTSTCASDATKATTTLTAVGWEDVDVDGVMVRAVRVQAKTTVSGDQEGTSERDVWGAADRGLVLRERVTLTTYSNQPVFGRTRYHEAYEIRLTSLEPRR